MFQKVAALALSVAVALGCAFTASADIPASAYVQDGLVVQFDGIDNAKDADGNVIHSAADGSKWLDLVSGEPVNLYASAASTPTIGANHYAFAGKGDYFVTTLNGFTDQIAVTGGFTVEMASAYSSLKDLGIAARIGGEGLYYQGGYLTYTHLTGQCGNWQSIKANTFNSAAVTYTADAKSTGVKSYLNGALSTGSTKVTWSYAYNPGNELKVGNYSASHSAVGKIYSARFYNRQLTAEEIARNAKIDALRFGDQHSSCRWNAETEKIEVHVSVALRGAGGTVSIAGGGDEAWVELGLTVPFTVATADGQSVVQWVGGTPTKTGDGIYSIKADGPIALTAFVGKGLRTWTGEAGDGLWTTGGNWEPAGVPEEGDVVRLNSGKVTLTNSTPQLAAVEIASTLACSNWTTCIRAVDVKLLSGAVIKPVCAFSDAEMSNRVWVACHNIEVQTGGSINANNLGYKTGSGPCWKGSPVSNQASSYGGMAGSGVTYGSVTEPEDPGSGAGSGGTAGGGAIRIDATGALVLNGTITATGAGGGYWGPGDSGGGVYIRCASIVGVGSVSANAANYTGNCAAYYNGGGGRIAVHYNPLVQDEVGACEVRFDANGGVRKGSSTAGARCSQVSGAGSLYFTDDRFLRRPKVDLCGVVWIDDHGTAVQPTEYAFAAGQDFTNSKLEFPGDDTVVTYDGDLSFAGTLTRAYGFRFTGFRPKLTVTGDVRLQGAAIEATRGLDFVVGGDLTLADGTINGTASDIRITAGPTNETVTTYGATVDVGGKLTVGGNGYVSTGCCSTNGSIVALHVGAFRLDATGVLTASGLGWNLANVPGWPSGWTYGAAHGGRGGYNNLPVKFYGTCYDEKRNPMQPGAGSRNSGGVAVTAGGGVVFLRCDGDMVIDGAVSADGQVCSAWRGGTAGGSVNLACKGRLSGSGSVSAKGGPRTTSGNNAKLSGADGGAGGGGRIAIRYGSLVDGQTLLDHLSVAGGTGTKLDDTEYFGYAEDGTIYVKGGGLRIFVR